MVVSVNTQLLLGSNLGTAGEVARLLDVLEGETDFSPTRWGAAQGLRDPYDRKAILAAIEGAGEEGMVPSIKRTKPPFRYDMTWYGSEHVNSLFALNLTATDGIEPELVPVWLTFIDRLASTFVVDWGHVDMFVAEQDPATRMSSSGSNDHLGYYWRFGLPTLFARNYFGPRLLDLAPQLAPTVNALALPHEHLASGCMRVDLVPSPWSSAPAQLKEAQATIQAALSAATGLFARQREDSWKALPGMQWQSPTDEAFDSLKKTIRPPGTPGAGTAR